MCSPSSAERRSPGKNLHRQPRDRPGDRRGGGVRFGLRGRDAADVGGSLGDPCSPGWRRADAVSKTGALRSRHGQGHRLEWRHRTAVGLTLTGLDMMPSPTASGRPCWISGGTLNCRRVRRSRRSSCPCGEADGMTISSTSTAPCGSDPIRLGRLESGFLDSSRSAPLPGYAVRKSPFRFQRQSHPRADSGDRQSLSYEHLYSTPSFGIRTVDITITDGRVARSRERRRSTSMWGGSPVCWWRGPPTVMS